jgi:hypothetical protein
MDKLTPTSSSTRQRIGLSLAAVFCSIPLLLTGCATGGAGGGPSPSNSTPGAEQPGGISGSDNSRGTATAKIDGIDFAFELAFCAVTEDDTLIHGPGTSSTGEVAYLDIDFQYINGNWDGEVRIELGIDTQFASSDDFYLFTTHRDAGDKLIANIAPMKMFSATGTYWVDGEQQGVKGNVEVDCR